MLIDYGYCNSFKINSERVFTFETKLLKRSFKKQYYSLWTLSIIKTL